MNEPTWESDIIDTRDLARYVSDFEAARDEEDYDPDDWDDRLIHLNEEVALYCEDYHHGEVIIRDTYFTEYAEQLAEDIGAIDRNAGWPLNHIDWEAAAEALKDDYQEADIAGTTWYYR